MAVVTLYKDFDVNNRYIKYFESFDYRTVSEQDFIYRFLDDITDAINYDLLSRNKSFRNFSNWFEEYRVNKEVDENIRKTLKVMNIDMEELYDFYKYTVNKAILSEYEEKLEIERE